MSLFREESQERGLIGSEGGGVQINDGTRIMIPPGALTSAVPVELNRLDESSITSTFPPELTFLGGFELGLFGQTANKPLQVTLENPLSSVNTGSQTIIVELKPVFEIDRLVFSGLATVNGDGNSISTIENYPDAVPTGIRTSGRYGFFRYDGQLDLISGMAREESGTPRWSSSRSIRFLSRRTFRF